jgi:iron complex outermembrane receptor protein
MRKGLVLALLATSALGAGPAWAQSTDTDASKVQVAGLEKVVVTARKRQEDQQVVPISITALNQADLDRLNVKTIEDLKYVSPSVYIAPTTFRQDTLNITIRGQRNFDAPSGGGNPGLGFDTASAVYKDGVYYARAIGLTGSLFDLDNVAVLKGPQGTLVGRNTTGGAILYNSRDPQPDFGGYVQATVGDYARAGLQGAINLPLNDTLFLRIAANSENQKGYLSNIFQDPASGRVNNQAAMGFKKLAGVVSLKWQPDDTFNVVVRADISTEHDTGSSYHDLGTFTGTVPSVGQQSQYFAGDLQHLTQLHRARAGGGFLVGGPGCQQPVAGQLRHLFGHHQQELRRYRCAPDGRLSHLREFRHRGQPRPAV